MGENLTGGQEAERAGQENSGTSGQEGLENGGTGGKKGYEGLMIGGTRETGGT